MNDQQTVRVFRGRTTREAMKLVKHAFGEDAVILETTTQRVKDSELLVQITAAPGGVSLTPTLTRPVVSLTQDTVLPEHRTVLPELRRTFELNGLTQSLSDSLLASYQDHAGQLETFERRTLAKAISLHQRFSAPTARRRALAFLGPTGVGKTTTVAKLATIDMLQGRSVGLITIDTRRIGAVEQLGTYAKVLGIEMLTAASPEELKRALCTFQSRDRIYIDTAGSGPWDRERLTELQSVLHCGLPFERMLLVSASANAPDLQRIVRAFAGLGVTRAGVTKIDETCFFGPCLSTLVESGFPLELFSNGPNVPEDLEHASAERVAEMIVRVSH